MQSVRLLQPFSSLPAAIEDYLLACAAENKSPSTLANYRISLRRFARFAGDVAPAAITPALVRRFVIQLQQDGLTGTSQNHHLRALKTFLAWLALEGDYDVEAAIVQRVKTPRADTEQPYPFSQAELVALFGACGTRWYGVRTRAILAILLDVGLRASELCGLRLADINLETGDVHVRAATDKTRKGRDVVLGRRARRDVGRWWAAKRHQWTTEPQSALFLGAVEEPLAPRSLDQVIARLGARAGVANCYPHRFRHTFAYLALKAGMSPFAVMTMLGHTDLSMTRKYIKLLDGDVREEKRKKSPLDGLDL